MEKLLKVAVVLSAHDRMTRVINQAVDSSTKKLTNLKKQADRISSSAFAFGRDAAAMGIAIGAPLVMATREAVRFEDKMADVAKVMGLAAGSKELQAQGKAAKELAIYLAQAPEDAADLMANLAQGGVLASELPQVAKIAGEVGVAFGMMAGDAGESFIKMRNALGVSIDQAQKVTDAMNHLGNTTSAASDELFRFMAAGGAGVARALDMGGAQAAAFGSLLISVGKSAEESGTIMERFMKGIMNNDSMRAIFQAAGGGTEGVMAVLQKGADLKDPTRQFAFFRKFGQYGTDIRLMAQNMDLLKQTLGSVANESDYTGSALAEFQNRQATSATQMLKLQAQAKVLAINLGNALLPVVNDIVKAVTPLLTKIINWIEANPELTATILKITAGIAAFALATSGVSFVVGGIAKAVSMGSSVFIGFSKAIKFVGVAFQFVSRLFLANPIGLLISAIVLGVYLIIKHWDKIKAFFIKLWDAVKKVFISHVNWVKGLGARFMEAGKNIIMSLVNGMLKVAMKPAEVIRNIVKKVRDFLPFSPAKEGPLRDIHRIRLVETIAEGIRPDAAVMAMRKVSQAVFNVSPVGAPALAAAGGGGGAVTVNFAPSLTVNGGGPQAGESIMAQLKQYQPELLRMIEDAVARKQRAKF